MMVRRERPSERMYVSEQQNALVGADTVDSASTLVYILGVGFMIYVGLEFVLPAIFGATAKTKSAYQRLKTPSNNSGPPATQPSSFYGHGQDPSHYSWSKS